MEGVVGRRLTLAETLSKKFIFLSIFRLVVPGLVVIWRTPAIFILCVSPAIAFATAMLCPVLGVHALVREVEGIIDVFPSRRAFLYHFFFDFDVHGASSSCANS